MRQGIYFCRLDGGVEIIKFRTRTYLGLADTRWRKEDSSTVLTFHRFKQIVRPWFYEIENPSLLCEAPSHELVGHRWKEILDSDDDDAEPLLRQLTFISFSPGTEIRPVVFDPITAQRLRGTRWRRAANPENLEFAEINDGHVSAVLFGDGDATTRLSFRNEALDGTAWQKYAPLTIPIGR